MCMVFHTIRVLCVCVCIHTQNLYIYKISNWSQIPKTKKININMTKYFVNQRGYLGIRQSKKKKKESNICHGH